METIPSNILIRRATPDDVDAMVPVAQQTILESHGHSASAEDMNSYIERKLTHTPMLAEVQDDRNLFYVLFENDSLVGYAKIILNSPNPNTTSVNVTKLERIYLLRSHHGKQLGQIFLDHLLNDMRAHHQEGVWLNVWIENPRAIAFYVKNGFEIIGKYAFEVSPTHSNPNHVMYKRLTPSQVSSS